MRISICTLELSYDESSVSSSTAGVFSLVVLSLEKSGLFGLISGSWNFLLSSPPAGKMTRTGRGTALFGTDDTGIKRYDWPLKVIIGVDAGKLQSSLGSQGIPVVYLSDLLR